MSALSLSPQHLEILADLIADRLSDRAAGELIDAAELARRLGRNREWIYDHSDSFGAIRLGGGERPRLLFRWPAALERLEQLEAKPPRRGKVRATPTKRPRKQRTVGTAELLPIRAHAASASASATRATSASGSDRR